MAIPTSDEGRPRCRRQDHGAHRLWRVIMMRNMTGMWDEVEQNAVASEKIRRLRSALREQADLEVLAVVTMGDLAALLDLPPAAPAVIEPASWSTAAPPARRRVSEPIAGLEVFPSEHDDGP